MLRRWFGLSTPVSRRFYATTGFSLAALKYAVDAATVFLVTGRRWGPLEYLRPQIGGSNGVLVSAPTWLMIGMALWTLPFLWIGLSMSVRRSVDAGQSAWLGLLYLVPFANYLLMLALCVLPSAPSGTWEPTEHPPLVDDRLASAMIGIASGCGFALAMVLLNVYVFSSYGSALFFGTPVVMGALGAYVLNRGHPRTMSTTLKVASLSIFLTGSGLLLFALEGAICILMSAPIAAIAALLGAVVGRAIAINGTTPASHMTLVVLVIPLLGAFEELPHQGSTLEVTSSVEVNAPAEAVWNQVIHFAPLPEPTEAIFRAGVSYPRGAHIEGSGVGAVRYCEFSTGPFVEPITRWEQPTRLSFDVAAQPPPMEEWSPYRHLHPPHLDGYFRSTRGEFRLVPLDAHRTRLEGSTWYRLDLAPNAYWNLWAKEILHAIHGRVLAQVKQRAEATR